ncbi:RNA polymerase sigma factor [Paraliomyxa miuraensis]|uniref:RNA polymerase sigma factor n=1 Tax=Paraliomyxa miuraensis TaxID=376150 RepID=UPI002258A721|nr:sigma-70 family RNA polymerase sigma factor [Paraliomyxa miuraensis]MCX4239719.1 sigma-70 family RNA polymerase sigma factor [Paraliomyxa miuraensis]
MVEASPPPTPRAQAAALYVQYSEELLAFFRAALPIAKVDAKDLLQQTFVELLEWLAGDPARTITSPRGLLYKIARCRLYAHRVAAQRTLSSADVEPTTPDAHRAASSTIDDDLEYLASLQEDRRGLLRAMRRLGSPSSDDHAVSDLQLAVYLRFWAGMTETEVGEVLEHPRATIAGQLRRAKAELSSVLAELERRSPGSAATSTTLLERWWQQIEARADEVALTDPDPDAAPPDPDSNPSRSPADPHPSALPRT